MKKLTDSYELYNGVKIPCIGFGTWQAADGDTALEAVRAALDIGYRHIDTAAAYGNEESVGRAVKSSGLPREELFITSKLWNAVRGYEETVQAFEESLRKLGMDYMDLYLIHWPNPIAFRSQWKEKNAQSWRAMEDLYKAGKIRSIGVSNFMPRHLDALLETAEIVPMVNQLLLCPGELQEETAAYCRKRNILLEAYSPLGTGRVFDIPKMKEIADKYGKSIAQICIRFSLQKGFLPLPKSVTAERIAQNTDVFQFEISQEDMNIISEMEVYSEKRDPDTVNF